MRKTTLVMLLALAAAACGGGTKAPEPFISGLAPRHLAGIGGTQIEIQGNDFVVGDTQVTVNGRPVTNLVVLNRRRMTCTAPAYVPGDPLIASLQVVAAGLVASADEVFGYVLQLTNPLPEGAGFFGGTLRSVVSSTGPVQAPGRALAVADFDGQGGPDIAVGVPGRNHSGFADAGEVLVFFSNGDGTFSAPTILRAGTPSGAAQFGFSLDAGDMSGDGVPDLLIGSPGARRIYTAVSDGSPRTFQAPVLVDDQGGAANQFGFSVIFGNFDGAAHPIEEIAAGAPDWTPTLFVPNPLQAGHTRVFQGGQWSDVMFGTQVGQNLGTCLLAADLTADGVDDIVIASPGSTIGATAGAGSVWLLPSDGNAVAGVSGFFPAQGGIAFAETLPIHDAGLATSLAAGHFDAMGGADLLVGVPRNRFGPQATRAGTVEVFYGDGTGSIARRITLSEPVLEAGAAFGLAVAVGDFDGDGRDDAAVSAPRGSVGPNAQAGRVSYFLNNPLNDDLEYSSTMNAPVPEENALFGISLAVGDFNGDGRDDLVVASIGPDAGLDSSGEVFIVFQPGPLP